MAFRFFKRLFDPEAMFSQNMLRNRRLQLVTLLIGYMLIAGGVLWALSILFPLVLFLVQITSPFLLGFILAYILNPGIVWMRRRFDFTREGAVIISTVVVVGTVGLIAFFVVLLLFQQSYALIEQVDRFPQLISQRLDNLDNWLYMREREALRHERMQQQKEAQAEDGATSPTLTAAQEEGEPTPTPIPPDQTESADGATTPTALLTSEDESNLYSLLREGLVGLKNQIFPGRQRQSISSTSIPFQLQAPSGSNDQAMRVGVAQLAAGTAQLVGRLGTLSLRFLNWLLNALIFLSFTVVITFFMLLEYERIGRAFWKFVPFHYRDRTADLLARIDFALGGYLRGQLTVCLCVGTLWTLWLILLGYVQYALLVGFITGLVNFIPYLGPVTGLISGMLYVVLAGFTGPGGMLGGLIMIVVGFGILQFIEGFVFQPLLVGKKAQLNPLLIIFALLIGAQAGVAGMLLAVPIAAVARVLLNELVWKSYYEDQVEKLHESGEGDIYSGAMLTFKKVQEDLVRDSGGEGADDLPGGTIPGVTKINRRIRERRIERLEDEIGRLRNQAGEDEEEEDSRKPVERAPEEEGSPAKDTEEKPAGIAARRVSKTRSRKRAPAGKSPRSNESKKRSTARRKKTAAGKKPAKSKSKDPGHGRDE